MSDLARGKDLSPADDDGLQYYKKDFWSKENLKHANPHFRLQKAARIVNQIARGKECDLLDVGCGPATLMSLLNDNIHYYGIDIAIHDTAPNLLEADLLESPIGFADKSFDIVIAQGVFEYVGTFQLQKFAEVREILKADGTFIVSYTNFGHRHKEVYWPYSNVQSLTEFREDLECCFNIDSSFPSSHNWNHGQPNRWMTKTVNRHVNINIPVISPVLAVDYFFICSPDGANKARG